VDCKLTRNKYGQDGILGVLESDIGTEIAVTLEHAYLQDDGSFAPKIPAGVYICKRGMHTLEHHPKPFEAFELQDVPGHTNILIHVGNYNRDSEGCILLGAAVAKQPNGDVMITASSQAFAALMVLNDVDEFTLTVVG
jgi:Family of unknown function (DUF5675)